MWGCFLGVRSTLLGRTFLFFTKEDTILKISFEGEMFALNTANTDSILRTYKIFQIFNVISLVLLEILGIVFLFFSFLFGLSIMAIGAFSYYLVRLLYNVLFGLFYDVRALRLSKEQ